MEECPVCGEEMPFSATECPSCGYEAEPFFLAEQVMSSKLYLETLDVPTEEACACVGSSRWRRGLRMRARDNGKNGNGNGRLQPVVWK